MNKIVRTDDRWLWDNNPIEYQANHDSILFHELTLPWPTAEGINDLLKRNDYFWWETKEVTFWSMKIFDNWWNTFIVKFSSEAERDNYIEFIKQNFKYVGNFSEKLEHWRQIPRLSGYFEYEWNYYAIIHWLNKLTDETNPEEWIYKWVIICPSKYYQITQTREKTAEALNNLDIP